MNLTYRGIRYQSPATAINSQSDDKENQINSNNSPLSKAPNTSQVILIRPIHYYTYRGVSYTKNLVYDTQTKNLLDIDRQ